MVLQDIKRRFEAQERVADRHGEVAGDIMLLQLHIEVCCQDLVDLGVQDRDGAGPGARKFFLQGDGFFEFPDLLQDLHGLCDRARVVDQAHEFFPHPGKAEELVHPLEQGQPQA